MPVSDQLIDAFIEDFREKRERTCRHGRRECRFVRGMFPIPWFGDSAAYGKAGNRRIITVGVNPSPLEFADGPDAPFALRELPETGAAAFLREQCDGYFGRHPSGGFDGMEPVLRTFDASYRAGQRTNVAIHVNAFSGLSTDPAWEVLKGKLGGDYEDLFGGFARPELFYMLMWELEPDVVVFGEDARGEMRSCLEHGMRPARPEWRQKAVCCRPFG
ncbi:MAG: hypothetical protein IKQ15_03300 [Kiritimatiellae bacterium]|nr:hypothetical protein [Kiritimatiellia bacterium]